MQEPVEQQWEELVDGLDRELWVILFLKYDWMVQYLTNLTINFAFTMLSAMIILLC